MSIYEQHVRKQKIKSVGSGFLWFLKNIAPVFVALAVIFLIFLGAKAGFDTNNNDYAGYGPNHVTEHNYHALGDWVGFDAKEVSRKRSRYTSHKAWATQYMVDKRPVCVYVWGGSNKPEQSQVVEGACA